MTNHTYTTQMISVWDEESKKHLDPIITAMTHFIPAFPVRLLDIGSNVGKFPEMLREHVDIESAILVEPIVELMEYARNKLPEYTHVNRLIGGRDAETFYIYTPDNDDNLGLSRILIHHHSTESAFLREMATISLTEFLTELYPDFHPNVIKIDAEGFDIQIVEGLFDYINASGDRPLIVYECGANAELDDLKAMYATLGYTSWSAYPPTHSRDEFLIPADWSAKPSSA